MRTLFCAGFRNEGQLHSLPSRRVQFSSPGKLAKPMETCLFTQKLSNLRESEQLQREAK